MSVNALALAQALLAAPSITPAKGAVFDVLEAALLPLGFNVDRFVVGVAPDGPVENLLATRRSGTGPHFAFAGHLDVVPPGEEWQSAPFIPEIRGGNLHGRGAVDMKGAIAAFVAAASSVEQHGLLSLIITGDEEGPATFGTVALIERMRANGLIPDICLVGEPTSAQQLGDTIKIGRRGSLYARIEVDGVQGHVAYPQLARNPIPPLLRIIDRLLARRLDEGTDWFEPSNLEVTSVDVGNPATNIIPGKASARVSIRFNDLHRGPELISWLSEVVATEEHAVLVPRVSGEAFLTAPGSLSDLVAAAIRDVTGLMPKLSTSGGTSDARFLSRLCPVVEFGAINATMHKVDEAIALPDLAALQQIYTNVLNRAFSEARAAA